jgi:uncharacterized protein
MKNRRYALRYIAPVLLLAVVFGMPSWANRTVVMPTQIHTKSGAVVSLQLEVAATPKQRERGLMQRKTLAPYDGMLFVFPETRPQKFWMKDTLLALDIVFIDAQQRIVFIGRGIPHALDGVGPETAVSAVIELAAGRAANEGIAIGDTVSYEKNHPSLPAQR